RHEALQLRVSLGPNGNRSGQESASLYGELRDPAPSVGRVRDDTKQTATLQRLESRGERRSVHGEELRDAPHRRWVRLVERHHQRELPVGEPERAKGLVEAPRQRPRSPLSAQAQAMVAYVERRLPRDGAWP